jgi:hypothetical protein
MDLFDFISRYFWLICIGTALINYLWLAHFSQPEPGVDPVQRRKYMAWFWGLSTVPWWFAGYAQLTGEVPKVWAFFRPQDRNPYVWAFYASILAVYVVTAYWVLFRDGARIAEELRLVKFRAPGNSGALSAFWIKVLACWRAAVLRVLAVARVEDGRTDAAVKQCKFFRTLQCEHTLFSRHIFRRDFRHTQANSRRVYLAAHDRIVHRPNHAPDTRTFPGE